MNEKERFHFESRIGTARDQSSDATTLKDYDDLESIKTDDLERELKRSIVARDEKLVSIARRKKSDQFCQTAETNEIAQGKDDWIEKLTKLENTVGKLVSYNEQKLHFKQRRQTETSDFQEPRKPLSSAQVQLEEREAYYRKKITTLETSKLQLRKDLEDVKQQCQQNAFSWKRQLNDISLTTQLKVSEVTQEHVIKMEKMKKDHDLELLEVTDRKNAEIKQLKKLIQDCQHSRETMSLKTREFERKTENIFKELRTDMEILSYEMLVALKDDDSFASSEGMSSEINSDGGNVVGEMRTLKNMVEHLMRRFSEARDECRKKETLMEQWKQDKAEELTRVRRKFAAEKMEALEQMKERLLNMTPCRRSVQSVKSN